MTISKFLFVVLFLLTAMSNFAVEPVSVTYIANDGYIFSDGTHKVAVDCMFYLKYGSWHSPNKKMKKKMENGEKPFDNIDVIIVTHAHGDHYKADMVAKYMSKIETTLIAPPQAIARLKKSQFFIPGKGTILTAPGDFFKSREFKVKELNITTLTLRHVGKNRPTQNMVVRVGFKDLTITHAGDAKLDDLFEAKFPKTDIVMLSYWQGFKNETMEKINKNIKPKYVIFKHAPYKTIADSIEKIKNNYGKVSTDYSVFTRSYETVKYKKENNKITKD
ncbi:MAG: MBL fold metallo-hydrolase [bacterium]|nr:MBL fold metallo-hydrolase [bacterium]